MVSDLIHLNSCKIDNLDLCNNKLTSKSGEVIASIIKKNKLSSLNLRLNQLGMGAHSVFSSLNKNTSLKKLNLAANFLDASCSNSLIEFIRENRFLTDLDLSSNSLFYEPDLFGLLSVLNNNHVIKACGMQKCGLSEEFLSSLKTCLKRNESAK